MSRVCPNTFPTMFSPLPTWQVSLYFLQVDDVALGHLFQKLISDIVHSNR